MKACFKCFEIKEFIDFHKHAAMFDGHINTCKPCVLARTKKWRNDNRDSILSKKKQYREAHPEKIKTGRDKHYAANRGKVLAANRLWAKNNPGKMREMHRTWYANNPDKASATQYKYKYGAYGKVMKMVYMAKKETRNET